MVQDSHGAKLSAADREALKAELEELKMKESTREQRRLTFEDGEGVLAEDERGLGYAMNDRDFFGSDDDVANASGGEGNFNRELNRRPRKRQKTGKSQGSKVRLPQNDSLAEKMRRRNIEFELRYGSHRHTTKALESLSREQEELLQLVVACALYPNIALPGENNSERCAAECVFHTQQVPFVNLHPSSVIYPQLPTALSRDEALAFGSILQTHMPFLTHVTRCPVVPVVLLCAVRVEMAEDCRMLICDQWLQLTFTDTEELLCLIEDALLLRFSIQSALDREVLDLFEVDCDDDVPCDAGDAQATRVKAKMLLRSIMYSFLQLRNRRFSFGFMCTFAVAVVAVRDSYSRRPQFLELEAIRFKCGLSTLQTRDACTGPHPGNCKNGTRCFIKNDFASTEVHAVCCCDRDKTPIDKVIAEDWRCWATRVQDPPQYYCDIQCCSRDSPQSAVACFGNNPICCDKVTECGINLEGNACCASKDPSVRTNCCASRGTTCWYHRSWLKDPWVMKGQPCCYRQNGTTCFAEAQCATGLPPPAAWLNLVCVLAAAAVQERWCSSCWRSSCRSPRKARRYAILLCVLYSMILATVMFDLSETTLLLAERLLLAVLVLLFSFLLSMLSTGVIRVGCWLWHQPWRVQTASGNTKRCIAVLINIQEYVHWPRVVDKSWGALCENMQSRSAPADVITWPDLMERHVDSLVDLVVAKLHGLEDARVLIYISCHSQMMDNVPQFLPADARGWGDGVSLSWLVRRLDAVQHKNARFYIIVNGCLTNAGRIDRWCRCCRRVQQMLQSEELDSARLSTRMLRRRSDPQVWMLFATDPGREVAGDMQNGDLLTRKFLEALNERPGSLEIDEIYNELHTSLWNLSRGEGGSQHPYLITTGRIPPPIPRQSSEESQQKLCCSKVLC
ncbi:Dhx34 [Symbiodinium sp. CCMP2592]|nr:Dhx34 [Symbiodinium sp. CCMP2592]